MDILIRAVKTAVQTISAEALVAAVTGGDLVSLRQLAIGALAAFISAIWNAVLAWSAK